MGTKKWYLSKAIWNGILTVLLALYGAFGVAGSVVFGLHLPVIPEWIFGILGSFGIVIRKMTTTVIE